MKKTIEVFEFSMSIVFPLRQASDGKTGIEGLFGYKAATCKIGALTWGSYGGGKRKNESFLRCACRELGEESRIHSHPSDLTLVGAITFHRTKVTGNKSIGACQIYTIPYSSCTGHPTPTKEMLDHQWYPLHQIPYDKMMPDYKLWLPQILVGEKTVNGEIHIRETHPKNNLLDEITSHSLEFQEKRVLVTA